MSANLVINAVTEALVKEVLASEAIKLLVGSINELTARNKELSERLDVLSAAQDKTDAVIRDLDVAFGTNEEAPSLSAAVGKLVEKHLEENLDGQISDYLDNHLENEISGVLDKSSVISDAVESALDNASISISCR